jgi:acetyl esterase/lipase
VIAAIEMAPNHKVLGEHDTSSRELVQPQYSIFTRLWYSAQIWGLKAAIFLVFRTVRLFQPTPPESRPTKLLAYPCRPNLRTRIFIPKSKQVDNGPLPLYLDLHGGGHSLMFAEFDDEFCATLANRFNIIVVGIEYSLAPSSAFPTLTNDVVAIAQATIDNPDLNIDKSRVVLGGFSAGGNLTLSAAQYPELRERLKGIVAWYPPTDYTLSPKDRQASRPYRYAKDVDDLKDFGPVFEWAYIPPGHDLRDPLISTRFVRREDLPKWIYIIGAEYDMLEREARDTAFDLAGLSEQEREDEKYGFERDTLKWTLVRGVRHGFTHDLKDGRPAEEEAMRKLKAEEMMEMVGEWLFKGPFARA